MKGGIIHDSDLVSHVPPELLCRATLFVQNGENQKKVFWSGDKVSGERSAPLPCIPIVRYSARLPPPSVAILNHRSQHHGATPASKVAWHRYSSRFKVPRSRDRPAVVGLRRWVSCHRPAGISRSGTSTVSAIDAKSTGGGVPCLAGRLHHSCRSFSHVCDTLAAAPRHLTLVAVPCLVSSVQFSACLVTSPTFVLFVLLFCKTNRNKEQAHCNSSLETNLSRG